MHPNERRERILAMVRENRSLQVDHIVEALGSSAATIRRDLAHLEARNQLRRFHGGVRLTSTGILPADGPASEDSFNHRLLHNAEAKIRIARAAAGLLEDGASLLVDTGTTTIAFAREAATQRQRLTVITNSVTIASIFGESGRRHRVHLLGGELEAEAMELLGRMTLSQISSYRVEHVVLTVGCVDETGIFDFDEREAEVARAMCASGQKLTVLADHSKMLRAGVFPVADLSRIATLVTDAAPPQNIEQALIGLRGKVIVA